MKRWICAKEKFEIMGFAVYPDAAEVAGVPVLASGGPQMGYQRASPTAAGPLRMKLDSSQPGGPSEEGPADFGSCLLQEKCDAPSVFTDFTIKTRGPGYIGF